ncbi:threonine/serine ThrE exporter family protein [Mycolicibacterium komossense]|uniref:threonine/serine ThrE exporter family protein n=1 Tax=Mycolicibacterium komossense TaxID=1779 RepID=UPI0021F2A181|nr:threonine/serine exporter family protein [Mycolicibacterium komossense]
MTPEEERGAEGATGFIARLGATMAGANYPVTMVQHTMVTTANAYHVTQEILVLPNYVHVGGTDSSGHTALHIARPERDLRYHQTFPLARLISRAQTGSISPADGMTELDRIYALPPRFPVWVGVIGYAIQSTGLALILQPAPWALAAALGLGLMVGILTAVVRVSDALEQLLPIIVAFLVATISFTVAHLAHYSFGSLRVLIAPLAYFMPGAAITLAVIELSTHQLVSGSSRLISGFIRLGQLAFGILIAAQVTGLGSSNLVDNPNNLIGPWAPWVGVLVYAIGTTLFFGPPRWFLPWMVVILLVSYSGQVLGNAIAGSYASGFFGGVVLTIGAVLITRLPNSPPTMALILPGFWLLVPGSLGLIGVTELVGGDSSAVLTATIISLVAIALGMQTGLLISEAVARLCRAHDPRAFRG